jgi:hypothetical protein
MRVNLFYLKKTRGKASAKYYLQQAELSHYKSLRATADLKSWVYKLALPGMLRN